MCICVASRSLSPLASYVRWCSQAPARCRSRKRPPGWNALGMLQSPFCRVTVRQVPEPQPGWGGAEGDATNLERITVLAQLWTAASTYSSLRSSLSQILQRTLRTSSLMTDRISRSPAIIASASTYYACASCPTGFEELVSQASEGLLRMKTRLARPTGQLGRARQAYASVFVVSQALCSPLQASRCCVPGV